MSISELADMDLQAVHGQRLPVNSRILTRRWGPFFGRLLREAIIMDHQFPSTTAATTTWRMSTATIRPWYSNAGTKSVHHGSLPTLRPRVLYLPHTYVTLQVLVRFLYTGSLPAPGSSLCTPQILCSLLQIARPYQVDGLMEATVERLHQVFDSRNAAAVFNASAMAAGGGKSLAKTYPLQALNVDGGPPVDELSQYFSDMGIVDKAQPRAIQHSENMDMANGDSSCKIQQPLRINTAGLLQNGKEDDQYTSLPTTPLSTTGGLSHSMECMSHSDSEITTHRPAGDNSSSTAAGAAGLSSVIGLQKRGLRGLIEGRRLREQGSSFYHQSQGSFGDDLSASEVS